jgi:hypothetical protein
MSEDTSHYDRVIADLEAKCEQLNGMIETLKQLRGMGTPAALMTGTLSVPKPITEKDLGHDAFFQMTIPDAARKYLAIVKRTKPASEIIEALVRGGMKSAAKDFGNSVRSIISRDSSFIHVNGEWGLATWYPATRREGKKGKEQAAGKPEGPSRPSGKPNPAKKASVAKSAPQESMRSRILALLADDPNGIFTPAEIAARLEAVMETVRARLSLLVKEGRVIRVGEGKYKAAASEMHE